MSDDTPPPSRSSSDDDPDHDYLHNTNCSWLIRPDGAPADVITLTFGAFETERDFDVVTVYDGDSADAHHIIGEVRDCFAILWVVFSYLSSRVRVGAMVLPSTHSQISDT